MKLPKCFIGWTNVKWFILEMGKTMSDEPSYFSKKRVQSWTLFIAAETTSIIWFCHHYTELGVYEMLAFTGAQFVYAGYQVRQIQLEKKGMRKDKASEKSH